MLSLVFDLVQANPTVMLGVLALLMTINMGILLGVVREPRGAKGEFKTGLPQTFGALPLFLTRLRGNGADDDELRRWHR